MRRSHYVFWKDARGAASFIGPIIDVATLAEESEPARPVRRS
jgi:hypothetical protein